MSDATTCLTAGAVVFIDHWFYKWQDADIVFSIGKELPNHPGWFDLTAPGYGCKDDYGMGSVFANQLDFAERCDE